MQRKDDKVGNNTGHMKKKDKGKKECREKRPNRFTKKASSSLG